MSDLNAQQPPPAPGAARPTWELVVHDMRARDALGGAKYGVRHQHDNGRDHLVDLYQELLDAACYVRAEIERRIQLRKRQRIEAPEVQCLHCEGWGCSSCGRAVGP